MPTSKRETIEPNAGDKRYARRDARGRFTSQGSPSARKEERARRPG
jgi:hypothetical protein